MNPDHTKWLTGLALLGAILLAGCNTPPLEPPVPATDNEPPGTGPGQPGPPREPASDRRPATTIV